MIRKPYIHFLLLTVLNGALAYLYLNLIKRMSYFWHGLLDQANYPTMTQLTLDYGIFGILFLLLLSIAATGLSFKNRIKEDQSLWSAVFVGFALSEIAYLTFIALGLMIPAITISTHLEG